MKTRLGGMLVAVAIALCSCKPQHSISVFGGPTTPAAPVTAGYLAVEGSRGVEFMQWTDSSGTLSGTDQSVQVSGEAPNLVANATSLRLAGTLSGNSLSLSLEGNTAPVFGTMSSGSFTLDVAQSNGTLAPITFTASSAAAYNSAVEALDQQVAQENQQVAGAQAQQQTLQGEEKAIDDNAKAATSDLGALPGEEAAVTAGVKGTGQGLQSEIGNLASVKAAASMVESEAQQYPAGNNGSVCVDASAVGVDASAVGVDATSVGTDAIGVETALSELRGTVAQLAKDASGLQSAEAELPTYVPASNPSPDAVSQATAAAGSAAASAVATSNGDIDQANATVTTAYGYAAQATQAGNCGAPGASPHPEPHIS